MIDWEPCKTSAPTLWEGAIRCAAGGRLVVAESMEGGMQIAMELAVFTEA